MRRLDIDHVSIAGCQISLRTVRGTLVCFGLANPDARSRILVGAHPVFYLIYVND